MVKYCWLFMVTAKKYLVQKAKMLMFRGTHLCKSSLPKTMVALLIFLKLILRDYLVHHESSYGWKRCWNLLKSLMGEICRWISLVFLHAWGMGFQLEHQFEDSTWCVEVLYRKYNLLLMLIFWKIFLFLLWICTTLAR